MMIECGNCNFIVDEKMKFSLMQNSCPSCGSNLFSGQDMALLGAIQGRLSSQGFSTNISKDLKYDISLFIFSELKDGIGRDFLSLTDKNESHEEEVESVEKSDDESTIDSLRAEVEAEVLGQSQLMDDEGGVSDEDLASKAERLKLLRQNHLSSRREENSSDSHKRITGRISGFKGVTRSS